MSAPDQAAGVLPIPAGAVDLDEWVRAVVRWHFDPTTASPFWLRQVRRLEFDPLTAVQVAQDLSRFPDVSAELRRTAAADLIPRGCLADGRRFWVWESGGTTGSPKRIVDSCDRRAALAQLAATLAQHGLQGDAGDWLHLGPTGPHLVGRNVGRLAQLHGRLCHYIDCDPRWVRRLLAEGRQREADRYIAHLVEQAVTALASQPIAVLACTPPLLEALCLHGAGLGLLRRQVRGVIWFGTSASDETLRLLEEELLPGVAVVGWYGNTLMGIACQRPRQPGERYRAVFQPPFPTAHVQLVDGAGQPVGYGETGRVVVSALAPELFLPNVAERDQAVRVPPAPGSQSDGLARVAPLARSDAPAVQEGVY